MYKESMYSFSQELTQICSETDVNNLTQVECDMGFTTEVGKVSLIIMLFIIIIILLLLLLDKKLFISNTNQRDYWFRRKS